MQVGSATDVGLVREGNEDALLVLPTAGIVAVADGLGGHAAGEIASAVAVETLKDVLGGGSGGGSLPHDLPDSEVGAALADAVQAAHAAVVAAAEAEPGRRGMGTTVVLGRLRPGRLLLAHVGDSRAYLLRGGDLARLTEDHGVGGVLTQALGLGDVEPDVIGIALEPADRLLLCTDGLTDTTHEVEIARVLGEGSPQEACDALVEAALRGGGIDNVTVVVADAPQA